MNQLQLIKEINELSERELHELKLNIEVYGEKQVSVILTTNEDEQDLLLQIENLEYEVESLREQLTEEEEINNRLIFGD